MRGGHAGDYLVPVHGRGAHPAPDAEDLAAPLARVTAPAQENPKLRTLPAGKIRELGGR
jgi:hypothetical protein